MDNADVLPIFVAFGIGVAFVVFSLIFASPISSADIVIEAEYIDVTIADLKSAYEANEPIIFSVKTKGVSDSADIACNNYPPAVAIRDDSNGDVIRLNPVIFNTALLCVELPASFDHEFTFGDREDIPLDKAGSYTVIASYDDLISYEDIIIEKKFFVTG